MGKGKSLDLEKRAMIIALHNEGLSLSKIAKEVSCPKSTVGLTVKRFVATGSLKNKPITGRHRIMNPNDDKYLLIVSKRDRRKTVPQITEEFNLGRANIVSGSTIRRSLIRSNMKGRVGVKKPLLRQQNIEKRLKWAKSHVNWTPSQCGRVLFTDESKFELFGNKRRLYVRRMPHERYQKQCLIPTVKHGGGSVMVWGGISSSGVVPLLRIVGIMKKENYHSMLVRHIVPQGQRLLGTGFILQQDNDPKHTAIINKNYLANKEKQGSGAINNILPNLGIATVVCYLNLYDNIVRLL